MHNPHRSLLIATDIDGTLLDDDGRLPFSADAWRRALRPYAVAFASSRTLDELMVLQRALGVAGPCIAEDGAVLAVDVASAQPAPAPHDSERVYGRRTMRIWQRARTADALRAEMHDIGAVQHADAAQLGVEVQRELGFRTTGAIRRALSARRHSLLMDPKRLTEDQIAVTRAVAAARGLQLRRGGRWLTMADTDGKGAALSLLRRFTTVCGVSPIVAAIGNEENDVTLLQKADLAFVIRNPGRGPHPALTAIPHAVVLETEGPGGWMEMLSRFKDLVQ